MPESLPHKYTCSKCYTVAIIPVDAEAHAAKCPVCSPNEAVLYKRGIILDPSKPVVVAGVPEQKLAAAPSISLASAAVADSKVIDSLTTRVAELEQENNALKAQLAQKEVKVPSAPQVPVGVQQQTGAIPAQQLAKQAASLVPPITKTPTPNSGPA